MGWVGEWSGRALDVIGILAYFFWSIFGEAFFSIFWAYGRAMMPILWIVDRFWGAQDDDFSIDFSIDFTIDIYDRFLSIFWLIFHRFVMLFSMLSVAILLAMYERARRLKSTTVSRFERFLRCQHSWEICGRIWFSEDCLCFFSSWFALFL